jgi:transposase
MNKSNNFSAEVWERAVHGARASRRVSVAVVGDRLHSPQDRLREPNIAGVVKRDEVDSVEGERVTTSERNRLNALEREVKALCHANDILTLASAYWRQRTAGPSRHRAVGRQPERQLRQHAD